MLSARNLSIFCLCVDPKQRCLIPNNVAHMISSQTIAAIERQFRVSMHLDMEHMQLQCVCEMRCSMLSPSNSIRKQFTVALTAKQLRVT